MVPSESLGSRLHRQRLADDLTQGQLAERFGVRQQTIGAWERGERPQSRFHGELANYLGLRNEHELMALIDSQLDLPTDQDAADLASEEAADADAATMRLLARSFVQDQLKGSLPPAQAADIYRNLTEYFRSRAIDR